MKKRIIAWFIVWVISLVTISFYGGALSYGFFFAVTLIPVISLVSLMITKANFKIYQELASRVVRVGEMTDYHFILQNDSFFAFSGLKVVMYPDFFEVDNIDKDVEYELLPGEEFRFDTKLTCMYRGEYEVGVKCVYLTDCLHFLTIKYNLLSNYKAIVTPRVIMLDSIKSMEDIDILMAKDANKGQTYPDVVVRDYVRGDSMRLVHWKASAKSGKLKVRYFYDENKQGIGVFTSLKRFGSDRKFFLPLENKILEILLAITHFFAYQDIPVRAMLGGKNLTSHIVHSPDEFEEFYEVISNVSFNHNYNANASFETFYNEENTNSDKVAFVITHEIDKEMLAMTDDLAIRGIYVVIYVVNDEELEFKEFSNERRQIIRIGVCDEFC